jgi:hypothetical protein
MDERNVPGAQNTFASQLEALCPRHPPLSLPVLAVGEIL